jgi:hypothetical protein
MAMDRRDQLARSALTQWAVEPSEPLRGPHALQPTTAITRASRSQSLCDRDESDADRSAVELAQRGRMILDVSTADLEAAETTYGPFHATTWHFRNALGEAERTWAQLRAELGSKFLETALNQLPLTVLTLGRLGDSLPRIELILIAGQTYRTQAVTGTELAPVQWRLTRLSPPLDHRPYYICRLADGSTQCDCAEWTYRIAQTRYAENAQCKHVAALAALGWI